MLGSTRSRKLSFLEAGCSVMKGKLLKMFGAGLAAARMRGANGASSSAAFLSGRGRGAAPIAAPARCGAGPVPARGGPVVEAAQAGVIGRGAGFFLASSAHFAHAPRRLMLLRTCDVIGVGEQVGVTPTPRPYGVPLSASRSSQHGTGFCSKRANRTSFTMRVVHREAVSSSKRARLTNRRRGGRHT